MLDQFQPRRCYSEVLQVLCRCLCLPIWREGYDNNEAVSLAQDIQRFFDIYERNLDRASPNFRLKKTDLVFVWAVPGKNKHLQKSEFDIRNVFLSPKHVKTCFAVRLRLCSLLSSVGCCTEAVCHQDP